MQSRSDFPSLPQSIFNGGDCPNLGVSGKVVAQDVLRRPSLRVCRGHRLPVNLPVLQEGRYGGSLGLVPPSSAVCERGIDGVLH